VIDADTEKSIAQHLEDRSAKYADLGKKEELKDRTNVDFGRLLRLWKMGKPSYWPLRLISHASLMVNPQPPFFIS
jgi:hypothetical protein